MFSSSEVYDRAVRISVLFFEDKTRFIIYLHTLTAHKVSYNTHSLFVLSEGDTKFELLFTTLNDKFLA